MSLREKLEGIPAMLEVIPPYRRASKGYVRKFIRDFVTRALDRCRVDAVNIPEIVEENYRGEPYLKNMDPLTFYLALKDELKGRDAVINKIVVHCTDGAGELKDWAAKLRRNGVENVVAVGGSSETLQYPGPDVREANRILRKADLCCGNILIPEREGEAKRMLAKTDAGAEFFTTQAIFLPDTLLQVLREYATLCKGHDIQPATVLVSYTPVADREDIEFLRWLGVDIPSETEARLLAKGKEGMAEASIRLAEESWDRIISEAPAGGRVPVGLNLEYISRHNLDSTVEMGKRLIGALE